ncbi:cytochrome c biogenesis protein ResB [Clavibacter michiganensis subsp. insidiosus]|uniref:Cytochrome c biogenesis protein ResB n=1 Tax=Clavibacter michiganensis subsp. insidiosus TaxID=33014 RepID=A0A399MZI5_9MICO|nr:cytochrome c biogenesis protein ResB [Clavibacter michiganensis]AWG00445.1 cytochrome c biogenesis protein [Clavibacter michiganensis subsp. insidiosus]OQJ60932.1 cytochrome C biogenesis protein [Clavibacter michiganensis subsp. insidiosus]RII87294.1 cytochrome c biogenesis protein ResB [Clavibacter michiganensis subsp. insidiosus]RIJ44574.1 cytochrome c biogenesis protein ResB [Clavibacter michiganensis subsp. insidiosus]RMC83828.1 cytochrome c biogenesis protein ResB [Clavibacter michigan
MSRPSDHVDSPRQAPRDPAPITQPKLGFLGTLRWFWRQLTSMRTALFLLLLLAFAAIPGSLVPQRSSDPNGVTQFRADNPDLFPVLDKLQVFDTYSSVWFSSIYLLLFISLIGCVVPRAKHHFDALRQAPPKTPARLSRLAGYTTRTTTADPVDAIRQARALLKRQRYRTVLVDDASAAGGVLSVSAERGYLRETGNLVFHSALVGILITVGIGGGFGYSGQKVLVEGQSFVNTLSTFDSFNPGRFFDDSALTPYRVKLNALHVQYEQENPNAIGQPLDFTADVTADVPGGQPQDREVKVNDPLAIGGTDMYLLGNGYAPHVTVRDPAGTVVYSADVPFLPQDAKLTSLGVVKVPDGLREQVGMLGFFYPTQGAEKAPFFSSYPDRDNPLLTLNVYTGDLGIDGGVPTSVYTLDTGNLTQLTGGKTGVQSIELAPGQTTDLPNGLGSVSLDAVPRFVSFDVHHDPTQRWVLLFAILVLGGLLTSLFVPRRRVWVKAVPQADGSTTLEYAGLARGEDPTLEAAVAALADKHVAGLPPAAVSDAEVRLHS